MAYFPKRYTAGLSKSGEKKQRASINKGKRAVKSGERLPKSYFKDRQAIGGESLKEDEEKEPGAISSSKTAEDVIQQKRREIVLGDKGEAGTGTVKVPKGTGKEQRRYMEAVRRRQGDPLQEKLDAQKAELKKSFSFGSRPIDKVVYQRPGDEEEAESEDAPDSKPLMGEPSDLLTTQPLEEAEDTGTALAEGDIDFDDFVADTGLPELKPGQKVVQSLGPDGQVISRIIDPPKPSKPSAVDVNTEIYAEYIPGSEDMDPEQLREASLDAAAKQYGQKYENQQPVSESTVEFDGVEYVEEVFADGAVFFVPTGEDGDYMRGKNKKESK